MDTRKQNPTVELNEAERRHIFARREVERASGEYGVWSGLWERIAPQIEEVPDSKHN